MDIAPCTATTQTNMNSLRTSPLSTPHTRARRPSLSYWITGSCLQVVSPWAGCHGFCPAVFTTLILWSCLLSKLLHARRTREQPA
jgi:hypothetical protein